MKIICKCGCGKLFEKYDSRGRKRMFIRGHQLFKCKKDFKKGNIPWNKELKGIHLSPKSEFKKGMTPWNKNKPDYKIRGSGNSQWKGGKKKERELYRHRVEYKVWRNAVFMRDKFTCQNCGYDKGNIIQAHHVVSWSSAPKLRFDVNNGVTLCIPCHKETDSYPKNWRQV